jgi:ferritin-like metal-binding protein YciE
MQAKNPREIFVALLSDLRQSSEKSAEVYQEIGRMAEDPQIKEVLDARAFASRNVLATLDQCFKMIGEQPMKLSGRLREVFLEDFRKELKEIESPVARRLFILAKLNNLTHLRIAEYEALVSAADLAGHYGVGLLLETCLADKLAFVERTRRLIRAIAETRIAERKAAASA